MVAAVFLQVPHDPVWREIAFLACCIVFASCMRLTLLLPKTSDEVNESYKVAVEAFSLALERANLSVKEAAHLVGEHPERFRKRLKGEYGITLKVMLAMPYDVWFWFMPALMSLIVQRRLQEFRQRL